MAFLPPIDLSDLLAEIQVSFTRLEMLAPNEGPWNWQQPILRQWMMDNGFPTHDHLLDNPAAAYVVLQSLRQKIQRCQQGSKQPFATPGMLPSPDLAVS